MFKLERQTKRQTEKVHMLKSDRQTLKQTNDELQISLQGLKIKFLKHNLTLKF